MFYAALAKPALSVVAIVAMGLVAAVASDDSPQPATLPSSSVSLVASAEGSEDTNPELVADAKVHVDSATPPSPRREPGVSAPSPDPAPSPEPSASAEGSEHQTVQIDTYKKYPTGEVTIVLNGDQSEVTRAQRRIMEMFDQPPTPPAPPLAAVESRSIRVHTTDGDHDIRVPDINVTAPAQPNFVWNQAGDEQPSVEEMELGLKYWETRAQGLDLKADGIEQQIERLQQLKETGSVSANELSAATERVGDMTLLRADAYRAQAKVLEMKRKIEQRKKQATAAKTSSVPAPALPPTPSQSGSPQPAESPNLARVYTPPATTPTPTSPQAPSAPKLAMTVPSPATPLPALQWLFDFDEARKVSEEKGRRILVHNDMPYSHEDARFRAVIDASPSIQLYVRQHYVPLRINPYTKSETLEQLRVDRIPPMGVFAADGRLLKELTLPQQPTDLLLELRSVAEGDSSGQAIPHGTAKTLRDQRAEPVLGGFVDGPNVQAALPPEDMLLPHENVRVTITQKRPREGKWVVTATLDHAGHIQLKEVGLANENLGMAPIGGMDPEGAAKVVLSVLQQRYGKFFDSMDFDVKVERNRDMGEAKEAVSGEESSSTSPPAPPAPVAQELPPQPADAPPIDGEFELLPWEEDGSKVGMNPPMLQARDEVIVEMWQERPYHLEQKHRLKLDAAGYIEVPGTNRITRISGLLREAADRIMLTLRTFHGKDFDTMGFKVNVEPTGVAARRLGLLSPVAKSPNEALKQQAQDLPSLDPPGPTPIK